MNEEQAIADLNSMIFGDEAPAEEPQAEAPREEAPAKEPEAELKIDVAKLFAEQNKIVAEQQRKIEELMKAKEEAPAEPSEEDMLVRQAQEKLGLDMQKQQQLYQMAEEYRMQKETEALVSQFKKEFPEIELKDMGKFAEENGMMDALNSRDLGMWGIVAKTMRMVSKPVDKPDAITPTAQKGAEVTVWDRMKKGESVSETEQGAALLKAAGL